VIDPLGPLHPGLRGRVAPRDRRSGYRVQYTIYFVLHEHAPVVRFHFSASVPGRRATAVRGRGSSRMLSAPTHVVYRLTLSRSHLRIRYAQRHLIYGTDWDSARVCVPIIPSVFLLLHCTTIFGRTFSVVRNMFGSRQEQSCVCIRCTSRPRVLFCGIRSWWSINVNTCVA